MDWLADTLELIIGRSRSHRYPLCIRSALPVLPLLFDWSHRDARMPFVCRTSGVATAICLIRTLRPWQR